MSAKHTPGPWSLEPVEDRSIKHLCPVDGERMSLLTIVHQDETPFAAVYKDADARLIAAAPCLLDALQELTQIASVLEATCLGDSRAKENRMDRARAAIAKATGETK
jgi:hypothetical protein